jgi:Trypsin
MRKALIASFVASSALLASTTTSGAINTYNAQAAPERTEVGAYVALWDYPDDDQPARFDWVCSGTMIDSDTFLTAAHCTTDWPEGTRHFVSLEQDIQSLLDAATGTPAQKAAQLLADGAVVEGDPYWDAAYTGKVASEPHDIGVLDFSHRDVTPADVWAFTAARLPTANQLGLAGGRALDTATWTVVGYGTNEAQRGPGGHTHPGGGVRMKADVGFDALNKAWVRLDMHESHGFGGACYGDSGGPNFVVLGGQSILAATTVTGDTPCYATNVVYRTDTASARNFLKDYVTLP